MAAQQANGDGGKPPWLFSWEQPWLSKKFVDYLPSNFI
jgi:hypothetical protein